MMKKSKLRITILISIFTILYLVLQAVQLKLSGTPLASLNGILMAFEFTCCLGMIFADYNIGSTVSYICMGISFIQLFLAIIKSKGQYYPIAGFFNTLIFLSVILTLVKLFKKREKDAVTDFLTGLLNRRGLYDLLNEKTRGKQSFHVVYIDLGNFKLINDNYGHSFGDSILISLSEQMTNIIGKDGVATRIGGDEFVLVLNENSKVYQITQNILDCITKKTTVYDDDGNAIEFFITACAGITKYPTDSDNPEDLIKFADIAMYQASKNKDARIVRFDLEMADKLKRQLEIEKYINEGLEHDYFFIVYQPQYMLDGKKLRGFESLLRLKTPGGEFISPAEFIPVAEKKDTIIKIDDYVLQRVMREFKDIVLNSPNDITISVNVSAKDIGNLYFPSKIRKYLEQTGFPAKNLEIEITEYCLVRSMEITIDNIKLLRDMGIQIALDDFGTGYTSLSYLAKMPINLLKVDKSLVDDIETNDKSRDFVNAVVSMGHLMGCEVIAEGTETENQLSILKDQKCDFVQGYVWGKPLDYEIAKELSMKE